jgi:hypothetical protein
MQAATGHAWHLYYAYTPWVFWAFDRACRRFDAAPAEPATLATRDTPLRRFAAAFAELRAARFGGGPVVAGAALVALMVYQGAIYPLPHSAFLLAVYAVARAAIRRRVAPLGVFAAMSCLAVGLAAPKLLPSLEVMARFPRLVDSNEYFPLNALVQAFTAPGQTPATPPARVPQWGWHEYGLYIGWLPFAALFLVAFARGEAERSLRYAGVSALVLALGTFHDYAPWALLHELPLFASQHVPSRWLYVAVLALGAGAVSVAERGLTRLGVRRRWGEIALLGAFVHVAFDISHESHGPLRSAFWMHMHPLPPPTEYFQVKRVPRELQYRKRDYAPEALPAMLTNRGVIDCTLMAALNIWAPRDERGKVPGIGAIGRDQPGYRGEAFLESGVGRATIRSWSPNEVVVAVDGAEPGARLILNQNWDPGWNAAPYPVDNAGDRVSVTLDERATEVRFRFVPWGLYPGLMLLALSVAVVARVRATPGRRSDPRAPTR